MKKFDWEPMRQLPLLGRREPVRRAAAVAAAVGGGDGAGGGVVAVDVAVAIDGGTGAAAVVAAADDVAVAAVAAETVTSSCCRPNAVANWQFHLEWLVPMWCAAVRSDQRCRPVVLRLLGCLLPPAIADKNVLVTIPGGHSLPLFAALAFA